MSGKESFVNRYAQLGWKFQEVKLRPAIRINQTNAKGKELVERMQPLGVRLEKISLLNSGYWVCESKVSPGATAEYLLGFYSIQEAAAQIPCSLFSNLRGKAVLDACAAPGGKTVQLADLMGNAGTITALDVNNARLVALANHLERCRVRCVAAYKIDARRASGLNLKFDRILLDVPCSGNFASDPEWFSRRTLVDIQRNASVQKEILAEASKCLAENGEIVYSTCSLEPEEDELNIDWAVKNLQLQTQAVSCLGEDGVTTVLGKKLDSSITLCKRIWPGETQGFFVCRLKKRAVAS